MTENTRTSAGQRFTCTCSIGRAGSSPREITRSDVKVLHVYALRSLNENQFYVGLTRDLLVRVQQHNNGLITSTKKRVPFELIDWEGCLSESDEAQREQSQKRMGKRYIKTGFT